MIDQDRLNRSTGGLKMKYVKKIVIVLTVCLITLISVELIYSTMNINVYRGGNTSEGAVWPWIIYDPLMGWMNKPKYIMPGKSNF